MYPNQPAPTPIFPPVPLYISPPKPSVSPKSPNLSIPTGVKGIDKLRPFVLPAKFSILTFLSVAAYPIPAVAPKPKAYPIVIYCIDFLPTTIPPISIIAPTGPAAAIPLATEMICPRSPPPPLATPQTTPTKSAFPTNPDSFFFPAF